MPVLYAIKQYQENSSYHVFNRGVNHEDIFFSDKDYWVFRRICRNLLSEMSGIQIKPFGLMPNHFHLDLFQTKARLISSFMKSLQLRYALYIKKKYKRDGHLFEGRYKARLITSLRDKKETDEYILKNPLMSGLRNWKHVGWEI